MVVCLWFVVLVTRMRVRVRVEERRVLAVGGELLLVLVNRLWIILASLGNSLLGDCLFSILLS